MADEDSIEIWRDVPDYGGRYRVSDLGRVMSLMVGGPRLLLGETDHRGRRRVILSRPLRKILVARLILMTFVGPCPPRQQACHWDDDPRNNRLSNLRWDTAKANKQDAARNGRIARGAACSKATIDETAARAILAAPIDATNRELAIKHCTSIAAVRLLRNRVTWKHLTA